MKGDWILYAGALAIPSLGAGITAWTHGFKDVAALVGTPGAGFMTYAVILGYIVMCQIATERVKALLNTVL